MVTIHFSEFGDAMVSKQLLCAAVDKDDRLLSTMTAIANAANAIAKITSGPQFSSTKWLTSRPTFLCSQHEVDEC